MPTLKDLFAKYKEKGFVVLAVHSDPDTESGVKAAQEEGMTYPVTFDGGTLMDALNGEYFPTFALIDRKGVVRKWDVELDTVDADILKLLAEK